MATNKTSTVGLANLYRIYYANYFLKNLRSKLVYSNLLSMEEEDVVQEMYGPVIQWTYMNDIGEGKTTSEVGTVNEEALSTSTVTAELIMKTNSVKISDRLKSFTLINKINAVVNRMSRSAALTMDGMTRRKLTHGGFRETLSGLSLDTYAVMSNVNHSVIISGTSYTSGSKTYTHLPYISLSGSGQMPSNIIANIITANETVPANFTTASMALTAGKLKYAQAYLENKNVQPFADGYYRCVLDVWSAYLLERDPELINYISYGGNGMNGKIEYMKGEIGAIGNIRLFKTTEANDAMYVHSANSSFFSSDVAASAWVPMVATITGTGCATSVDHAAQILGDGYKKGLNNVELNIIGFTKDKSDIVGQYMVIAYKIMTAVGILDATRGLNLLQFRSKYAKA